MRCKYCNKALSEYESIAKDSTGGFLDLCGECNSVSAKAASDYDEDKNKWYLNNSVDQDDIINDLPIDNHS